MKKRRIAVVSEARATYGYVKGVMHLIEQSERLELQLIVTGMHLLKEYGSSINEIVRDGFTPAARVDMYVGGDTPTAWSKSPEIVDLELTSSCVKIGAGAIPHKIKSIPIDRQVERIACGAD